LSGVELARDWPKPNPVTELELDIELGPYPVEALPEAVRGYCSELCRVTQAPVELAAPVCIGLLSACIGKGAVVPNAFRGMRGLPTLQFALALESGSGKSTVFDHALAPFQRWCKEQREIFKNRISEATGRIKLLEREISALAQQGDEAALIRKQTQLDALKRDSVQPEFACEDITLEAMAVQLGANGQNSQEALFSLSDDARQATATLLGRYNQACTVDDNLLVKGFSWSPHQQHRRKEGGSVNLAAPCVNVLWCIQPDLLDRLVSKTELLNSGFLQRFILDEIHWPAEIYSDPGAFCAVARASWDHLVNVLLNTFRLAINSNEIAASDGAKAVLLEYRNSLVARINDPLDLRDVRSFADRWGEWAWRFALVFHVTDHRREAMAEPISVETAQKAVSLARYYADRKLAVLAGARSAREQDLKNAILNLLADSTCLSSADLQRARLARTADEGRKYLDRLVMQGVLARTEKAPASGGPTRVRYQLPPPATNVINASIEEVACAS
jgi:hypothetical protein